MPESSCFSIRACVMTDDVKPHDSEQLLILFHLFSMILKTASVDKNWKVLQRLSLCRSRHFSVRSIRPEIRESFLHCLFHAIRWTKTSRNTNSCIILWFIRTIFYIAPAFFGVIILPYSRSWHQYFGVWHSCRSLSQVCASAMLLLHTYLLHGAKSFLRS